MSSDEPVKYVRPRFSQFTDEQDLIGFKLEYSVYRIRQKYSYSA